MRKITTQKERDNKTKRNQLIIGIILVVVLLSSTAGFAFAGRNEETLKEINYKNIKFVQDNSGYWRFNVQGGNFITRYSPEEAQDIQFFTYTTLNSYANKPLYFSSDFNEPNYEIARNLNSYVLRINDACLDEECEKNSPIKDCEIDNIIIIREPVNETERIYQENNCVYIVADISNQTLYSNAFLYKILGI